MSSLVIATQHDKKIDYFFVDIRNRINRIKRQCLAASSKIMKTTCCAHKFQAWQNFTRLPVTRIRASINLRSRIRYISVDSSRINNGWRLYKGIERVVELYFNKFQLNHKVVEGDHRILNHHVVRHETPSSSIQSETPNET